MQRRSILAAGAVGLVLSVCLSVRTKASEEPVRVSAEEQAAQRFGESLDEALARRDEPALRSLIAPEFEFVHSTGRVEGRGSFVQRAGAGQLASQRNPGKVLETRLRASENVAVRTLITAVSLPSPDSSARETRIVTVHVYAKSAEGWRWISAQSTVVAQQ